METLIFYSIYLDSVCDRGIKYVLHNRIDQMWAAAVPCGHLKAGETLYMETVCVGS